MNSEHYILKPVYLCGVLLILHQMAVIPTFTTLLFQAIFSQKYNGDGEVLEVQKFESAVV